MGGRAVTPMLQSADFWLTAGLLAAAVAAAGLAILLAGRWHQRQAADDPGEAVASLTSFRALYEAGELTAAEYDRIRAKLAARVKREVAAANPAAADRGDRADPARGAGSPAGPPPPPPPG